MSNRFQKDIQETVERCRRLANATKDMAMASKLLRMAEDLERATRHSSGQANRRNED